MKKEELKNLPVTTKGISRLRLEFPRLEDDSPRGCPVKMSQIRRYLRAESQVDPDLFFGRTALVGDVRCWLWGYLSADGETVYVTVTERNGEAVLSTGGERLTPEQYLGLQYAQSWRSTA